MIELYVYINDSCEIAAASHPNLVCARVRLTVFLV